MVTRLPPLQRFLVCALQDCGCHQMELPSLQLKEEVREYVSRSLKNEKTLDGAPPPDRRTAALLCALGRPPLYTTLRMNTLHDMTHDIKQEVKDALKQQYEAKSWENPQLLEHPDLPDLLIVPSLHRPVTAVAAEVIVDVPCGMAVLRGADVFAQGLLAVPPMMEVGQQVAVYADLDYGCRRGLLKPYQGRKVFVGNGVAKFSRVQLFCGDEKLSGVGIQMTDPLYQAPCLDRLVPDLVFPQNLPSIVCGRVLDPRPGECVLDMCAAPGGKTTHIAALMRDKGRVMALDKSRNKIGRITENCRRCGVSVVEAYHHDGTRSVDVTKGPSGPPPYPPETFDRVLLDAPCSALGQRPSLHNKAGMSEVTSYPPLQKKLFSQAVMLLRPGGCLVYSTCTIPQEENEQLVAWALRNHPQLCLVPQTPHVGGRGWPCEGLTEDQSNLLQRFDPAAACMTETLQASPETAGMSTETSRDVLHKVNTDTIGFFIAKFLKVDSENR